MNQTELIKEYAFNNVNDGESGNVSIKNNVLYHYWTPILERYGNKFIVNTTRYSEVTRFLQRKIKTAIPSERIIEVSKVPEGYKGNLTDFI